MQVHDVRLVGPGTGGPCLICGREGGFVTGSVVDVASEELPVASWVVCSNGPGEVVLVLTVGEPVLVSGAARDTFTLLVNERNTDAVDSPGSVVAAAAADPGRFGRALMAEEAFAHPLGQRAIEVMHAVYLGVPEVPEHVLGTGGAGANIATGPSVDVAEREYPEPMLALAPPEDPLGDLDLVDTLVGNLDCSLCGTEHRAIIGYVWENSPGTGKDSQVANFYVCGETENAGWGHWTIKVQISALILPPGVDTIRGQGTFTVRTDGERVMFLDPSESQFAARDEDPGYFAFSDGPLLPAAEAEGHPWAVRVAALVRGIATRHPAAVLMLGRVPGRQDVRGFTRVQAESEGWLMFLGDDVVTNGAWNPDPPILQAQKVVLISGDPRTDDHDLGDRGRVIAYTRAMGLSDGVLVDATSTAAEAGFAVPVALTRRAWNDLVEWAPEDDARRGEATGQTIDGRLWDVVWMAISAARANPDPDTSTLPFELMRVPRAGTSWEAELVTAVLNIGPGDQREPVATILLPGED